MAGEWAQKLTTERVIKHIQDEIAEIRKDFLTSLAAFMTNKSSYRRRQQIDKAYKLTRKSH